ncbi:MAG TPA: transcription elongation factor GreA [Acidimicrobiaceae bacterium]|nr:transcription elongation factor GreA [Acidimicrobiaceae bacterium]HCB37141.1 transcription elongation factor GreA [Acidimicrobiaceae bacterium]
MPEVQRLSAAAHARLQAELTDLTGRGRIDIAGRIETARLMGDLSENGDYHAAKEEQGKMAGRILRLTAVLRDCEIIDDDPDEDPDETIVAPGVVVELRFPGASSSTEKLLFGSIEERRDGLDVVSPGSPMGKALEGRAAGDEVVYETDAGEVAVEIVSLGR